MPTVTTSSEVFPDGSAIELVGSASGDDLALLHWDGERAYIAPQIPYGGRFYRPPEVHASIRRAIRLPSTVMDYGTAGALFRELTGLYEYYVGLRTIEASPIAFWTISSWFADSLPSPPDLAVSGSDLSRAITLFRLNCCVCRRGLILAEMTRSAFGSLPMELRPTLMIAQPDLPRRIWSLWSASNYRGAFIPDRRGTVVDAVCSKAIFTGMNGTSRWNEQTIHLTLAPAPSNLPRLDDREQKMIADKFLPMQLKYRFDHLHSARESRFPDSHVESTTDELARNLKLCVPDDPELMQGLVTLLDAQRQERVQRRLYDPNLAIVEVLWTELQDPQVEISISHLTDLTNALLHSCGANCLYSAEEVGWKLRQLEIPRHKGRDHMTVRFSQETSQRVHYLAQTFGLALPPHPNTCIHCAKPQVIDG
jgi:hypothetical protein